MARTLNVYGSRSSVSPVYIFGLAQVVNALSSGSSLHSKVPARVEVNVNVTEEPEVAGGVPVRLVSSAFGSTSQSNSMGGFSRLPLVSRPRTWKRCGLG